jgi:oligopeptide transport system ATP-binding protein
MSENLLTVRDLRKSFRVGKKQLAALDGIDLDLGRGETLGLVGESGCGKSTLARTLMMLERPDSGSVTFDGIDPFSLRGAELLKFRRRVQMVFQDPYSSLNPTKTIGATLSEAVSLRQGRDRTAVSKSVGELLDTVGLSAAYQGRKPVALSGGERQRVAIARALALEPRVVICDEPVSALDVSVQAQVLELLNEIRSKTGVSYLFISHDLAVVRQVADRIYVLHKGKLVESGPADQLLRHPADDYTRELLAAVPGQWDRDSGLSNEPPMPTKPH